jgi:hypothetical protein
MTAFSMSAQQPTYGSRHPDRLGPLFLVLVATLAFAPYFIWAHILLGAPSLFGKSLLLSVITTVVYAAFLLNSPYILARIGGPFLLVCVTLAVVLGLRTILYNETLADAIEGREGIFYFVYISLFLPFLKTARHRRLLTRIIVWGCLVQAIIGIVHNYYFPYIVTGVALDNSGALMYVLAPGQGGFRENGTVVSSNTYGSLLVLGMILMGAHAKRRSLRSTAVVTAYFGLCLWGIVLSGSRYALISGLAVIGYYVLKATPQGWSLVLLTAFTALVFSTTLLNQTRARFEEEGGGGRGGKTQLALELATSNVPNFLFGVPKVASAEARTADGLNFSDDSYGKLLIDYGVIGAGIVIGCACLLWWMLVRVRGWVTVCLLFLAGQFAVTNAVIWDWWLLYAGATVFLLNAQGGGALVEDGAEQHSFHPVMKTAQ